MQGREAERWLVRSESVGDQREQSSSRLELLVHQWLERPAGPRVMAHDPVDRRWAQSIATKPLKPFNFENLRRRNAPKQVQVRDEAAARAKQETKGNHFTVRQPGRLQELIFRDLDFEKDNVRACWGKHGMAATGEILLPDGAVPL